MGTTLMQADLPELELLHRGKVRDVYALSNDRLLMVASDRLSAYDVVLPDPIPGKGEILTRMSNFWFRRTESIAANHLLDVPLQDVLPASANLDLYRNRSVVTRRLRALPVEAIVRGYLIGSGWREYQQTGKVCGIRLPDQLKQAAQLSEPLFTPSSKAAVGDHDENISFAQAASRIGNELAHKIRDISLSLYHHATDYARQRGIIIADTKFEFGVDSNGFLYVIDEMLTPDSSRFWPQQDYQTGISPPSFDKQYVRDYLDTLDWNKQAPGPSLPDAVIHATRDKYTQALAQLTDTPPA